jgi:hypothetical protein
MTANFYFVIPAQADEPGSARDGAYRWKIPTFAGMTAT